MKTFITFSPQQENLNLCRYQTTGNERLAYGETRFPIVPVISGYAEPGEEIRGLVDQGRLTLKPQDPAVWYHTMPPVF